MSIEQVSSSVGEARSPEQRRAEAIAGLRAFADWLEQHPETEGSPLIGEGLRMVEFPVEPERLVERMRTLGAPWEIVQDSSQVRFRKSFGEFAGYELLISAERLGEERQVTRSVIEHVLPGHVIAEARGDIPAESPAEAA